MSFLAPLFGLMLNACFFCLREFSRKSNEDDAAHGDDLKWVDIWLPWPRTLNLKVNVEMEFDFVGQISELQLLLIKGSNFYFFLAVSDKFHLY